MSGIYGKLRNLHFQVKIGMILLEAQGTYFGVAYNAKYGICAKNKNKICSYFATNARSNVLPV